MLEGEVQKRSVALARRKGWWARKFTAVGRRSAPDYIFAKEGDWNRRVFFVEFKRTGESPTELQEIEHKEMREHGLTVYVCDSPESFGLVLSAEESRLFVR